MKPLALAVRATSLSGADASDGVSAAAGLSAGEASYEASLEAALALAASRHEHARALETRENRHHMLGGPILWPIPNHNFIVAEQSLAQGAVEGRRPVDFRVG